ncbi:mevalonate kinase [Candidatus Nitrososphaera evergladensis SR1]|jgi:mevalonate kinase|uniref:Mevalonate kinase n=1 Tax=Candidatus Nitrososphaera evergladensis SR1 TaxID=1459636 RepID=A0A075MTX5_9ARCH|nr:mevalonate kinase [Candidatus Nitrososphaera evergladensis]AIF84640.1 mevalonate kinase [Candidatus Nitrososphaera evergladensis SR1]
MTATTVTVAKARAAAPAKIILFGEHFVVYGNPAILASINRRITVTAKKSKDGKVKIKSDIASGEFDGSTFRLIEGANARATLEPLYYAAKQALDDRKQQNNNKSGLEIEIKSDIPYGVGLGSSAAALVATIAAVESLAGKADKKKVCESAIEAEKIIHKNSSGADCFVSTFGGMMHYSKGGGFKKIEAKTKIFLVIGDTGIKHNTGDLVSSVRKLKEANQMAFSGLMSQARDICNQALAALNNGNIEYLGMLMNENQLLLERLGVSHEKADDLIDVARRAGALGAKITGAGGGGAIIALAASKEDSERIASAIKEAGQSAFEVEIDTKGLVLG